MKRKSKRKHSQEERLLGQQRTRPSIAETQSAENQPTTQTDLAALRHPNLPSAQRQEAAQNISRHYGNHTLQRVLNAPTPAVQREVIEMEPMTIYGNPGGPVEDRVEGLEHLRGPAAAEGEMQVNYQDETIERNSPTPANALPWNETGDGWDGTAILTNLGQYDTISGTDSDGSRCVQAVAMASYIPSGPSALAGYLQSMMLDSLMQNRVGDRANAARRVIRFVKGKIENGTATYSDLSWAQEALHDLYFTDFDGTPEEQIGDQITPFFESLNRNQTSMNEWCNNPQEVMAQANKLKAGEQLIITTWRVMLNTAYDQLEDAGEETSDRMQVEVNGRIVTINRIPLNRRPTPEQVDINRDSKKGHQLLIMRDNTPNGPLRLYEPEVTNSGQHLETISRGGSNFESYTREDTDLGIYHYVQVLGKISPINHTSGFVEATTE